MGFQSCDIDQSPCLLRQKKNNKNNGCWAGLYFASQIFDYSIAREILWNNGLKGLMGPDSEADEKKKEERIALFCYLPSDFKEILSTCLFLFRE